MSTIGVYLLAKRRINTSVGALRSAASSTIFIIRAMAD